MVPESCSAGAVNSSAAASFVAALLPCQHVPADGEREELKIENRGCEGKTVQVHEGNISH